MVCVWCDASFDKETLKCGCGIVIKQLIYGGIKETRITVSDYAVDNNDAELKAIMYGLRHVDKPTPDTINIITDSQTAIDLMDKCVYRADCQVSHINPKYQKTMQLIIKELEGERIRIYHCKGHSSKNKQYSQIQAICDKLAKKSR